MIDAVAREITESYREFDEDRRLDDPYGVLQRRHTQEILARYLSGAGMEILDVGGATGAYAFWLAEQGHRLTSRRNISSWRASETLERIGWPAAWSRTRANSRSAMAAPMR